jgi:hypothetical protein
LSLRGLPSISWFLSGAGGFGWAALAVQVTEKKIQTAKAAAIIPTEQKSF